MNTSPTLKGNLYLIPSALGEESSIPSDPMLLGILDTIGVFIVENERSARRFLRKAGYKKPFEEVQMLVLNEHTDPKEVAHYLDCTEASTNVGIVSEAGCPGIADPGAAVVAIAHRRNVKVIPLVGACSLVLALMASGLNGQSFAFCGYLPRDGNERKTALHNLEKKILRDRQTQIFIETPYRNDQLIAAILATISDNIMLCIASDLTLPTEKVQTLSIREWKKKPPVLGKKPAVFLLGL